MRRYVGVLKALDTRRGGWTDGAAGSALAGAVTAADPGEKTSRYGAFSSAPGTQPATVAVVETNAHGQSVGALVPEWSPRPMPERVELAGRYVTAEPIDQRHTDALYASLCRPGDESLWTYRPVPFPTSRAEVEEELVRALAARTDSVTQVFVPVGGIASGLATFFPCVPSSGVVEISGVLFGRGMQRTAAATEAIHLLLRHVFDDLGYRRVEWKCDTLNAPSRRAAARFGFTYEGRFRQHMVIKGRTRDTDWFSILDSEWPAIRARHERWLDPANFDSDGLQRQGLGSI
ncbi:GNAT family N-acetyltransferase [Nocardioides houyundeii]|uniref:GNAT family N-acetyltransferase n=1 Tax=Nocardioides houyundeii TaxID=2045452 RepID=UPI001F5364F0|nr:GNAT family protein [Nocardioides houyundeii]